MCNNEKLNEVIIKEIKQIKEDFVRINSNLEGRINLLEQSLNEEKQKNINLQKIVDKIKNENYELKKVVYELTAWKKEKKVEIDSKIIKKQNEIKLLLNRLKKARHLI